MGMYTDMKYADLQALAKERGLVATGTTAELAARLEQHDAEQLLGGDDPAPVASTTVAPEIQPTDPGPDRNQAVALPARSGPYRVSYPAPDGDVSTEQNNHYRLLAYNQAIADGFTPRGGLAGVSRIGWENKNGVKQAVYEVVTRKQ